MTLIHGTKDRRAPCDNFRRMRSALEEAGNPPQTLVAFVRENTRP